MTALYTLITLAGVLLVVYIVQAVCYCRYVDRLIAEWDADDQLKADAHAPRDP